MAVRDVGPVKEGAPGIITGSASYRFFFWTRPMYLCIFADNLKIAARANQINDYDHGYALEDLEQPRLTLRLHTYSRTGGAT